MELRGQRQRSRSYFERATADGIRGLPWMSPLHSPSATPAAPHRNAKLNALHPRLRNLGLELRNGLALFQPASASRTAGRQRYFDNFINRGGKGPAVRRPI